MVCPITQGDRKQRPSVEYVSDYVCLQNRVRNAYMPPNTWKLVTSQFSLMAYG